MNHLKFLQMLGSISDARDVREALVAALEAFQHVVQGDYYSAYYGTEGAVYIPELGWQNADSEVASKLSRHGHEHPFCRDFFALKIPRAYRRSAMIGEIEWHKSAIYREVDSKLGIEDMIGLYFTMTGGKFAAVHCGRGRFFTEPEFAVAQRFHFLVAALLGQSPESQSSNPDTAGLSTREADVIRWVAEGKSNSEIAAILGISHHTVRKHLESILPKLGAENRTGAAREWLQKWLKANTP